MSGDETLLSGRERYQCTYHSSEYGLVLNSFRNVKYTVCEGVYEPSEDTYLLSGILGCVGNVLEIGTGTGVLAIYCALRNCNVTASDISGKALACAGKNMELNGISMKLVDSDLFSSIHGKYDEIIFNPPYLPSEDEFEGAEQWNGGKDGFEVTSRFLVDAGKHLAKGGKIRMILSDLTDIDKLISEFPEYSFKREREDRFDFESIYAYTLTEATREKANGNH